jgi:2-aminoadipate transaminase
MKIREAGLAAQMFDFTKMFATDLPAPSGKWGGLAKYNFTGGNNDAPQIPLDDLVTAASNVLRREGRNLAVYNLGTGPQGYIPLRDFIAGKLKRDAGMSCDRDNILVVSGSLQALDLVNALLTNKGDCVIVEQETYQGTLSRLAQRGVRAIGVPLDNDGMRMDALAATLADLKAKNVRPKFIYTIPTVQNPTATILTEARRLEMLRLAEEYGVPIVEDDCYADLIWDRQRPPAIYASSQSDNVIYIGSFSKSIAPALRVGYIVANWTVLSRLLALKNDGGTGALEQMILAEYCINHFAEHVEQLTRGLKVKLDCLTAALGESFGTSAEFETSKGGIFLWVKLPDGVDTMKLSQSASKAGVAINPGPEWSTNASFSKSRLRLCFAHPAPDDIRHGVRTLAEVCRNEFGIPQVIANVAG